MDKIMQHIGRIYLRGVSCLWGCYHNFLLLIIRIIGCLCYIVVKKLQFPQFQQLLSSLSFLLRRHSMEVHLHTGIAMHGSNDPTRYCASRYGSSEFSITWYSSSSVVPCSARLRLTR